jgi:RNA 3'-terminal phosphate cyclase
VGASAAEALLAELTAGGTVDIHAVDQLLPYMALAAVKSVIKCRELTEHARTNIWVIEQFVDKRFRVSDEKETDLKLISL